MAILMRNICDVLAEDFGTPCDNAKIECFMYDNCSAWCSENCSQNLMDNQWKCWEKYLKLRCVQESEGVND